MLTHTSLANELGYGSLPGIFKYNDAFAKKEDEVIAYLLDVIEPACGAFRSKKYGELFEALGRTRPLIRSHKDKAQWAEFFEDLEEQRASATVGDIVDRLLKQQLFSVPNRLIRRQRDLDDAALKAESGDGSDLPRRTSEYRDLRDVKYNEIVALSEYVADKTVFSTKHNVKGAEFDNVVVVLGRGWTKYDFAKMLSNHSRRGQLKEGELSSYETSRNLFYVAASRAKHNLVLIFTQELDASALASLCDWVGAEHVVEIGFTDENSPYIVDHASHA
jgi:DNA helicase-2/ATP-dependent DNA helicase PcrA